MVETKRWWLGVAGAGAALWLGSRLSSFGRARPEPKEEDFEVRLPMLATETAVPVAAAYYEDWGRLPLVLGPQVIIAIYSDGRVIWSRDPLKGGPPYLTARVDAQRVQKLLHDLEGCGVFTDPVRHVWNVGPDHPLTAIAIADGSCRLNMASWHELAEAIPGGVATSSGIMSLNGRDRAKVLAAEPVSYRHFRQVWDHVRALIAGLIPAEGADAGTVEFRLTRIAAEEPGD